LLLKSIEYTLHHKNGKTHSVSFPDELKTDQEYADAYTWCCQIYGGTINDWFLVKQGDKFNPYDIWGVDTSTNNTTISIPSPYFLWPYAAAEEIAKTLDSDIRKEIHGQFVEQKCECGADVTFGAQQARDTSLHSAWCPKA
jgi:hypothetical protein